MAIEVNSTSDSSDTKNNSYAHAMNFGTISPGDISQTLVIALNVPYVQDITNIRMGLTDSGNITFANNLFGITTSADLREDIVPESYFQGVNSSKSSISVYNVNIPNKDNHSSVYVYLNVTLPVNQIVENGMLKYKWFFDYSD